MSNNSELSWEDNGEPTPERFYEMAWQNGKNGIRDVYHFKKAFNRYVAKHTQEAEKRAVEKYLNSLQEKYNESTQITLKSNKENK